MDAYIKRRASAATAAVAVALLTLLGGLTAPSQPQARPLRAWHRSA